MAILEVGLGGRLDAVNIIDTDCAIITSIDLDHMELLGDNRESIGYEKAGIMRTGKPGHRERPHAAAERARPRHRDRRATCGVSGMTSIFPATSSNGPGPGAAGATAAWPIRRCAGPTSWSTPRACWRRWRPCASALPVTAQAVRNGLALVELPGRFQIVPGQPTLVLDVAHNPHSVAALAANLDAMGYFPTTHAVFGAMADKDLGPMLARVAPLVDRWYFTDLPTPRAASAQALLAGWQALSGSSRGSPPASMPIAHGSAAGGHRCGRPR